jgi:hypothetical protein
MGLCQLNTRDVHYDLSTPPGWRWNCNRWGAVAIGPTVAGGTPPKSTKCIRQMHSARKIIVKSMSLVLSHFSSIKDYTSIK